MFVSGDLFSPGEYFRQRGVRLNALVPVLEAVVCQQEAEAVQERIRQYDNQLKDSVSGRPKTTASACVCRDKPLMAESDRLQEVVVIQRDCSYV